jgi:integrase/recombinase XerD
MAYQYVREPLTSEESDELSHACQTPQEKMIIWTLLDTGLRVSELCGLTPQHILWQQKALSVSGKGGLYGKLSKKRVVPLSKRVQALLEPYFALHDTWFVGPRQVQKIVKQVANKARITRDVTPHILRHTFATIALQKGISIAALQKILGHDRLTTTAIYLNLTGSHVIEEFTAKW